MSRGSQQRHNSSQLSTEGRGRRYPKIDPGAYPRYPALALLKFIIVTQRRHLQRTHGESG